MNAKRTILYFCSSVHGYTHAVILALVPLLLLIRDAETGFDLSWRDSFLFAAVMIFIYGAGGIPAGYLSDRFGSLKVILTGLCVSIIALIGIFLCTDSLQFLVLISLLGLGSSFYHPSGLSLISKIYSAKKGTAMGTHGFVGIFGQIAGPAVSGVMGAVWGWRSAYLIWAVVGVVVVLVNISLILKKIESKYNSDHQEVPGEATKMDLKFMFQALIILILLLTIFRGWLYRGTVQVLPFFIEHTLELNVETAAAIGGIYVTLMYIAGSAGQLIGGSLSDKYGFKKPFLGFALLALIALIFMLDNWFSFEVAINNTEFAINSLLLGAMVFGFAFFGGQPIINAYIGDITPAKIRGAFYGITFFTRFGLSAIALILIGVLASEHILVAFYLVMIFAVISILIILAIKK
ncbi:MAG: MFS transporter [Thermoplasmata archaeon]|nr:MFS transporter [Thermoplasmata archaeon]